MKKNNNSEKFPLQDELSQLEKKFEQKILELKMARLNGDYKENLDQQLIEEKIDKLQDKINLLKIKKTTTKKIVTYRILETGEAKTIELTNEQEPDHFQNRISATSPLGLALQNKQEGEISEVKTTQKSYKIQIISVSEKNNL